MERFTYRRPTEAEIYQLPLAHLSRSCVVEYQGCILGAISLSKPNKYDRKWLNPYTNDRRQTCWLALSWRSQHEMLTSHTSRYQAALALLAAEGEATHA